MIVIDASALVAIAYQESEAAGFLATIRTDSAPQISACTVVEAALVIEGRNGALGRIILDRLLEDLSPLSIVAFNEQQGELARDAFRRFGKGRHAARLNLGDCFAYALAKALDAPLLFKGADFAKTDLTRA